jgi:hypothetical protein
VADKVMASRELRRKFTVSLLDSTSALPGTHDNTEVKSVTRFRTVASGIAIAVILMLQGCYTTPTPTTVPGRSVQQRFEESWQAVRGAAADVGLRVTQEDRAGGTLRGEQGSSNVVISVIPQADQTIQVGFSVTGGNASADANLKEHLTRAYQRRMGR